MLTNIARLYCGGGRRLQRVGWGCTALLLLGVGVVVAVAALLSSVMSRVAVFVAFTAST